MSQKTIMLSDLASQQDLDVIHEVILRMALKIVENNEGDLNEKLANPLAIQMLSGYLGVLFLRICAQDGIDVSAVPPVNEGSGPEVSLTVRTRH